MLHEHPERIIAAIAYSAAWDPDWDYAPEGYEVPILFRHAGPGEGADNIPATARHSFAHLRSHDAPASIAFTRGQGHNHSYMRTITIPFWNAALEQRLSEDYPGAPLGFTMRFTDRKQRMAEIPLGDKDFWLSTAVGHGESLTLS